MKQLNLIPESVKHKAAQVQLVPFMAVAGIIAVGLVAALGAAVNIQLESVAERLSTITSNSQGSTAPVVTVDADTTTRVATLNSLAKFDINWGQAYTLVQSIIPDAVVLTNFTYISTPNGMDLKLSGNAPSSVAFASFVESLQGNKKLVAPTVSSFSYTPASGAVVFAIDVTVPFADLSYPS